MFIDQNSPKDYLFKQEYWKWIFDIYVNLNSSSVSFVVIILGGILGVAGLFKGWEIGIYAMYPCLETEGLHENILNVIFLISSDILIKVHCTWEMCVSKGQSLISYTQNL